MVKRLLAPLTVSALVASTSIALFGGTALAAEKPVGDAVCAGNTIYTVCVDDIGNKGRYTAKTGLSHPVPGVNLLYGGAVNSPATSHSSYRSFTTGTTYTQGSFSGSFNLSPFASVTLLGTTGIRTTYTLPGPPTTPDELLIVQDVNVNGTTLADSNVAITTTITNQGMSSVAMGIRYLWDFQIALDDGPTFQAQSPNGPVLHFETEFTPPNFSFYKIVDNDTNPTPPTYQVFGTVNGPATLVPQPTPPTQLTYGCWPSSFNTSFDYSIGSPPRDVADPLTDCPGLGGDSDVIYWWGRSAANALGLRPGGTTTTNALLFAAAPNAPPPFPGPPATLTLSPLTATNDVDTQHTVTATVKDVTMNPVPNIIVRFSVTGSVNTTGSCTTNTSGQCSFTYTGPALPGADAITAFADTNNNNMQDVGEPTAAATKVWTVPLSTPLCEVDVTYGGWIHANNGDKANFGGNAKADSQGNPQGQEEYQDKGPVQPMNVHSINVLAVICPTPTEASIFGDATIDGAGSFSYRIDVEDHGEPGKGVDKYQIRLSNGYDSGDQFLEGGNVQIHK